MEAVRLHATLNWLIDTAADVTPGQDLEATLERYLDRLLQWVDAEQGSILLRDGDALALVAARGLSDEVTPGMRIGLREGPAGEVAAEGTPRLLYGELPSPRATPRPRSALIIPIRSRERIIGVLNLGKLSGTRDFTPEDLQVLSVVAAQLAWLLANFELMSKMWRLAITDELTGLYNRRYFFLRLREEMQRALRYDKPLSLVMLDLDGFKELNRGHGLLVADEVLAKVAGVIQRNLRAVDVAARYGGDEVVVILPETPAGAAAPIIARLQRAVADETFVGRNGMPVHLSVCAGIAQFPADGVDPEDLIRKADAALIEAKRAGSGRILLAE